MKWTDQTIPVECAECNAVMEGECATVVHIIDTHPSYSIEEAQKHARLWLEDAYETAEEFEREYYQNLKIERAIENDRYWQKYERHQDYAEDTVSNFE